MSSAIAPDTAAAIAFDSQSEGVLALLCAEEDIDEEILANLLSDSWPTPAVADDRYGLYLRTPLRESLVERQFPAVASGRNIFIWIAIRGFMILLMPLPKER